MRRPTVRVATAHLAPHILDAAATTTLVIDTIAQAAAQQASLIAFPESFLPGFPVWSGLLPPASEATHHFFEAFVHSSVYADGPEITAIRQAAKKHRISVSLGFSEKARWSQGTLWNSNVIIDEAGEVKVLHRKLVPTFYERLSWGAGDGEGLRTAGIGTTSPTSDADTQPRQQSSPSNRIKVGTLICGENTNPLARYAMISQGEDIHISSWPAIWPTRMVTSDSSQSTSAEAPTIDGSTKSSESHPPKSKPYNNILANRLRAGAHCFEGKCYGIMCAAAISDANITTLLNILSSADPSTTTAAFRATLQQTSRAASMFLDPTGSPVTSAFTIDAKTGEKTYREMLGGGYNAEEGVLFADLDLNEGLEGKQFHDLVGGYQRLDVFELKVTRERREPVVFRDLTERGVEEGGVA